MDCVGKIGYSHTKEWIWIPILSHCSMSYACLHAKSFQSCPVLCNPMDCNPPGSSVHGILQVRILEWVTMPSSRGSSGSRDWIHISYASCIGISTTRESLFYVLVPPNKGEKHGGNKAALYCLSLEVTYITSSYILLLWISYTVTPKSEKDRKWIVVIHPTRSREYTFWWVLLACYSFFFILYLNQLTFFFFHIWSPFSYTIGSVRARTGFFT